MGADNELTERLRFLSEVLRTEGAINASDDVLRAAAEIGRLRGELAVANECLGEERAANVLRTPAPAMPNGVEAVQAVESALLNGWNLHAPDARRMAEAAVKALPFVAYAYSQGIQGAEDAGRDLEAALRAADNRDAAGVDRPAYPEGEVVGACVCGSWPGGKCLRCEWIPAPAAVPAGEAVAVVFTNDGTSEAQFIADGERLNCPRCGGSGHVDDGPQPADGEAVAPFGYAADVDPGDFDMSHTMYLLRPGEQIPAGCTALYTTPPAPVQVAPQEGEKAAATLRDALKYVGYRQDGDLNTLAERAELWMRESKVLIAMQQELAARPSAYELGVPPEMAIAASGIRSNGMYVKGWNDCREATLQHRGDSQEVGRG